ncbi:HlyD family secretion protein [Allomuricauda sp. NBRC 101325]|uniref:HlyD family secretion protein n=1 Tax=Allomuricauda sp. NBRC 101325 TaxID=1113758 RepID=UPI0024A4F588|nr:HlyD family efflux transporter periplasmic adaptor subunit [Muricauda sp. NBRC 101325]GLU45098.1 hypothetical protein Musp01_27220 [Muricauda sp. NBRC 101325]
MQIFPKEILENTSQAFIPKNEVKNQAIYTFVLVFIILAFVSLPFIKINLYTTSRGLVKPHTERIPITSLNSGKVVSSNLRSNSYVHKGDVILKIENKILDEQIKLNQYDSIRLSKQIKDLQYLLKTRNIENDSLQSGKYRKDYAHFLEISSDHKTRIKKVKIDFNRNERLLDRGVIAKAEFENIKLEYDLAGSSFNMFKKQQQNRWQSELTQLKYDLEIILNKSAQFLQNKNNHNVIAPVSGSLVNLIGVEKGSNITSGTILAEISPDTNLLVECYVNPMDIGFINKSKPINFQIDAFNYNQWGLATGKILDISQDIEIIENRPVFKVRCSINEMFLELKNGTRGTIKKGMTLNARFELTERSLYQLLYDKVDNWINPTVKQMTSIN